MIQATLVGNLLCQALTMVFDNGWLETARWPQDCNAGSAPVLSAPISLGAFCPRGKDAVECCDRCLMSFSITLVLREARGDEPGPAKGEL